MEDTYAVALASHILTNYGPQIGNAAISKNILFALLKDRKRLQVVGGGGDFEETDIISENSNFGFRSHYDTIPTNHQDPTRQYKYEIKTFDGSVVVNIKHLAMNKSREKIRDWVKTLKEQAETTIANQFNTALWAASPGADDINSLPALVSTTPTTGTVGGQNRATSTWARNLTYTTAVSDIGSEAGLAALHRFRKQCSQSSSDTPDLAITTAELHSGLEAYLDSLRRLKSNERYAKMGFDQFLVGPMMVAFDDDCPDSRVYILNSRYIKFKILRDGNFVFEKMGRQRGTLNLVSEVYAFCNLTAHNFPRLGVMTNVSTT